MLAVKVAARSKVPGVVHDSSSSGQTLFVEPLAVLELSNRLAEAASAEREEVERILKELSALVGANAASLEALVIAAGELDLALASGVLSRGWNGAPVEISDEVRLLGARHPLLDAAHRGSDRARPRRLASARRQRPEHGRQDGRPEDARARRAAPPGGAAAARARSGPADLRPGAGGRRRRAVDRDEPLDVLCAPAQHRRDPRGRDGALARAARRARRRHRSGRGLRARAGAPRPAGAAGAADPRDDALRRAQGLGERDGRRRKRGDRVRRRVACAALPDRPRPARHVARAADRSAARARTRRWSTTPAPRIAPERLRVADLLAEAEAAERKAVEELRSGERRREEAERQAERARERESELEREIERVRASAADERARRVAAAERDLAGARAELAALREEIRAARRRERERPSSPAAGAGARPQARGGRRARRSEPSVRCAPSSRCR